MSNSVSKSFLNSSIGAKQIVAITGLLMILFLVAHMAGVMQIFLGQEPLNEYGIFLRELGHGTLIWVARIGLLGVFIVHIFFSIRLARLNSQARQSRYAQTTTRKASIFSRSATYTGLLITVFVLVHVGHFALGVVDPEAFHVVDDKGRHDVYMMMVQSFAAPVTVAFYIISMVVIFSHLAHGAKS
ncbi:MAG: succinate dehydrogenase cytochrome b subunit, partial [Myxococcota bacterium]